MRLRLPVVLTVALTLMASLGASTAPVIEISFLNSNLTIDVQGAVHEGYDLDQVATPDDRRSFGIAIVMVVMGSLAGGLSIR